MYKTLPQSKDDFQIKITLNTFVTEDHKKFNWPVCFCQKCQKKMWGHGYSPRYFSCLNQLVYLKRYFCPNCGSVITLRPSDFFAYIRTSAVEIYKILRLKITTGRWPNDCSRQRGWHWLKKFSIFAKMSYQTNLISFLDFCFEKEINFLPKVI